MDRELFIVKVIECARNQGFVIEINRDGLLQIDFGNKKLHQKHLNELFPDILNPKVSISNLIEQVAPGRPCSHKPMKEIISIISKGFNADNKDAHKYALLCLALNDNANYGGH